MKKFITKIFLFVFPVLLLLIIMELGIQLIPDDHKLQKKYLDANSNEIETLILGSSQTFCGINPKYFASKTYNVGYLAQTLDLDFLIVNKYKDSFKSLKTIVLPISYFSLFSNLRFTTVSWRSKKYDIYYDLNLYERIFKNIAISDQSLKLSIKILNDYYIEKKDPLFSDSLGWAKNFKSEYAKDLNETGQTTALLHRFDLEIENVQIATNKNKILLQQFMEWSENKNIKIILLTPPVYKTYRDNLDVEQLNHTIETANSIALKYNNCVYYNLMNDSSFIADDYYDANHLSEVGAKKLSSLLSSIIEDFQN